MGNGELLKQLLIEKNQRTTSQTTATVLRKSDPDKFTAKKVFLSQYQDKGPTPTNAFGVKQTSPGHELIIRITDIIGASLILVLNMPVMLLIAAMIKIVSTGPVLYKQKRVGKDGRFFTLFKFRTMVINAEKHIGPVLASKNDNRVIPMGKILRRTRLDELPQLLNILQGHMSLVGPRPERPYFVRKHPSLQGKRLTVKPGLTGLAQIRNHYDLHPKHKIKYDYLYIKKRSLILNLYILIKTVPVIFEMKGW